MTYQVADGFEVMEGSLMSRQWAKGSRQKNVGWPIALC